MKNKIKIDLIVLKKLEDKNYLNALDKVHSMCMQLKISNKANFCKLQLYLDELKNVTYEEVMSYNRLLDVDYCNSIKQIANDIKSHNKIIQFPKIR